MKMRNLENYGIYSDIVDTWEKNYSDELMPIQEEAVRDYGVLDYKEGHMPIHPYRRDGFPLSRE